MKQSITFDQLGELTPRGKGNLRKWFFSKEVEPCLLSIGQMIEFLADHHQQYEGITYQDDDGDIYIEPKYINGWKVETICDELWEEVKEVLENENNN